ncbi:hypothetical protein UQW22_05025 [Isoptericola halotolerans]|uniref:hypothetical protein n=1 Tax=Isoptericola halotolerans TaxID=300560 RepID=UPI00388D7A07
MGIVAQDWSDLPDPDRWGDLADRDPDQREAVRSYRGARMILLALDGEDRFTVPHYVRTAARGFKDDLGHQVATCLAPLLDRPSGSVDRSGSGGVLAEVAHIADAVATVVGPHVRTGPARGAVLLGDAALAGSYGEGAEKHASAARRWLLGVGICAATVAGVVAWLLLGGGATDTEVDGWGRLAVTLAPEMLATALLIFAISFCARGYRAHRSAQTVYERRMADVNTYVALCSSVPEGVEGRAAILTELARAVLSRDEDGTSSAPPGGDATAVEHMTRQPRRPVDTGKG